MPLSDREKEILNEMWVDPIKPNPDEVNGRVRAYIGSDPDNPQYDDLRLVQWEMMGLGANTFTVERYEQIKPFPNDHNGPRYYDWVCIAGADGTQMALDLMKMAMGLKAHDHMISELDDLTRAIRDRP